MKAKCCVEGCVGELHSKGMCRKHYKRMRRGSDPHVPSREEMTLEGRLHAKLGAKNPVTGCVEWQGRRTNKGHGQIWRDGTMVYTHRVAYELCNGPIPDGLCVLHRCDNPPCCNPEHLFLGTHSDNMADMRRKDRSLTGSRQPMSKLTESDVRRILERLQEGDAQQVIAGDYRITQQTVSKIKTRSNWKHIVPNQVTSE